MTSITDAPQKERTMTDNTTTREAIWEQAMDTASEQARTSTKKGSVLLVDAAIDGHVAHLWQAADDPEVVEAVAESWNGEFWGVYRADEPEESREYPLDRPFTDAVDGSGYEISSMHMATAGSTPTPDELHDLARSSLVAALTALLGPRPAEQEDDDER